MQIKTKDGQFSVLVVDDDPVSRDVAEHVARGLGFRVDTVESGSDAIKKCKTGFYNLVLMDVEMPGIDGLAATQAIRKISRTWAYEAKIVALTGKISSKEHVVKCLQAGMNDCLAKPLKPDTLKKRIPLWLQQKKAPDVAALAKPQSGPVAANPGESASPQDSSKS